MAVRQVAGGDIRLVQPIFSSKQLKSKAVRIPEQLEFND